MKVLMCIVGFIAGLIVGRVIYIVIDETIKRYRFKKEIENELNKKETEL